ncbi:MAG: hypothetical protein LBM70_01805 [Victivallales bacterium]|jgi:hypothetical protein|nr:hypothetical protein [Victivallales bacterium]
MSDKDLEIKRFMAAKIEDGESLSEVQKLVNEKFNTTYTFMDIRILASELENIDWGSFDPKPTIDAGKESEEVLPESPAATVGQTVVEVSKLVRPGTALSGTVTFRSGASAEWYVDSYGRLGIENLRGEQPSEEDVRDFQIELQKQLGGK